MGKQQVAKCTHRRTIGNVWSKTVARSNEVVLSSRAVRDRFGGVSDMTIHRWVERGILPPPCKINGRNYWRECDIAALQRGESKGAQ